MCMVRLDLVDLAAMERESGGDPGATCALDACPIPAAEFGAAFGRGTIETACDLAAAERRHPLHRLDKVRRTRRVD